MKVLIVCSGNADKISPFITDQVNVINKNDVITEYFLIKGKGIKGYLKSYFQLRKKIKSFKPNVVHAHYGLSGLLSTLQRKIPTVITFHGCDVNVKRNRILSKIAKALSCRSIYVSRDLAILNGDKDGIVIPCGVDLDVFYPIKKEDARKKMNLNLDKKYVLFSSSFNNKVKNVDLAKDSISKIKNYDIEFLELKGYTRNEVAVLMNAVDLVLLTSLREGSPQFIKESLACNTPIVSVNVGDIEDLIEGVEGNYISNPDANIISQNIIKVLDSNARTKGFLKMKKYDNITIALEIIEIYKSCNKA